MRVAREQRPDPEEELEADLARIRAERAADADEMAAMLVRVADTERARDGFEKRASGLEGWTLELEAKVAEARTRVDDLEAEGAELRKQLEVALADAEALRARVATLEADVATARREVEEAVEVERVKRGLEIDALVEQHNATIAALRVEHAASGLYASGVREKAANLLDDLDRLEASSSAARTRLIEQARSALRDHVTAPPPPNGPGSAGRTTAPTMPPSTGMPATRPKRKSRRPSAPPAVSPSLTPVTKPGAELETFEDLLKGGD